MRIGLYCPARLPVEKYGGTERVVVWLARGLAELGHEVVLLAGAGSRVPETTVVPLDPREIGRAGFSLDRYIPAGIDLLHAHAPLAIAPACPHLLTLHGNMRPGRRAPPNTIFVSADHARRHGGAAFVHNGLDPAEYKFAPVKGNYDLFLGRLHSAKGYRWAIDGARRTDRRLVVAGGWRVSLRPSLRFVGRVGGTRKAELLANACCLWMPALWDEPFGLTLIESLVSGTPVLGTRRGALPEVITPDVGALGDTLEELVALRGDLETRSPDACRDHVLRRFSHRVMAESYLRMYRHYLSTGTLPATI